jgi:eukaryotic-like serine/threonine-protein kinase
MTLPPRPKTTALSPSAPVPNSGPPRPGSGPGSRGSIPDGGNANDAKLNSSDLGGTLVMSPGNAPPPRPAQASTPDAGASSNLDGTLALPKGYVPAPPSAAGPAPSSPEPMSHAISSLSPMASDVAPESIDENMPTIARSGEVSSLSAPRPVSVADIGAASLQDWADSSSANVLAGRESSMLSLSGEQSYASIPPPGSRPDPYMGLTLDGRYKVESILGEGGMGVVYAGRHKVINKRVAIKVLRADLSRDHEMTERFLIEAQAASSIGHPHIVDVSDFGTMPDGAAYFVMEFLEGHSLTAVLEKNDRKPLPTNRITHIAKQIADGLSAAHAQGIVHRDLKPDNVFLVTRTQDKEFVKLLDFGIAKVATSSEAKLTRAGTVFGTPHYMSPEQAAGAPVDHRTDIYSLGVILYEMSSGKVPFDADNYMGILTQHMYKAPVPIYDLLPTPEIPRPLEAIILKALLKKPEQRYQSMQELIEDLDRLDAGQMPLAVSEMMARSGAFNIPTDYFDTKPSIANITAGAPASRRKSWGLLAGLAGVMTAVVIVAIILSVGSSGNATTPAASATAALSDSAATTASAAPVASAEPVASAAPAIPEKPKKTVQIIPVPLEAEIFVDGEKISKGPGLVQVPDGEKVKVEVRLDGFVIREVTLDGKKSRVDVKLVKIPVKGGGGRPVTTTDVRDPWAKKR